MFRDYGYYMVGMHALWWIFWAAVVGVFLYALRRRLDARDEPGAEPPRETLCRRLASGEIVFDEYEQRMALLNRDAWGR